MKPLRPDAMTEATRLTRAGRLGEAVAVLQKLVRGTRGGSAPTTTAYADATEATIARSVIDLLPHGGAFKDAGAAIAGLKPLGSTVPGLRMPGRLGGAQAADMAPAAGEFLAGSFSNEAGTRAYRLYVPSRHEHDARPLIVMLHGCQQSAEDFAVGTQMNFAAEASGCFVLYPEQPSAANASRCWNWFKPGDQQRGRGEPSLIAGMTRQIMKDYKIDTRRIYVAGLSAGGAAAATMGETYGDLYAAVGVHSGLACGAARDLPSAFAAMGGHGPARVHSTGGGSHQARPTIVFHGDRDTTVHPRNGSEVIARANAGGLLEVASDAPSASTNRQYTRSIQRDKKGRSVLELWELHGGGHAWSGGNSAGSFTDPQGPDATKEMLRFFLEHAQTTLHSGDGK